MKKRTCLPAASYIAIGRVLTAASELCKTSFLEAADPRARRRLRRIEAALEDLRSEIDAAIFERFPESSGASVELLGRVCFGMRNPLSPAEIRDLVTLDDRLAELGAPDVDRSAFVTAQIAAGRMQPLSRRSAQVPVQRPVGLPVEIIAGRLADDLAELAGAIMRVPRRRKAADTRVA